MGIGQVPLIGINGPRPIRTALNGGQRMRIEARSVDSGASPRIDSAPDRCLMLAHSSATGSQTSIGWPTWSTRRPRRSTVACCAKEASHLADSEGITGFMYGCAVSMLAQCWKHGEELRRWHNKDTQIGTEGDIILADLTQISTAGGYTSGAGGGVTLHPLDGRGSFGTPLPSMASPMQATSGGQASGTIVVQLMMDGRSQGEVVAPYVARWMQDRLLISGA